MAYFPLENSYNRIATIEPKESAGYAFHEETKELLLNTQSYTWGFCYAGLLYNSQNPKLALVNHQYPFFLNLQIYVPFTSLAKKNSPSAIQPNVVMQSKNIDPTFSPGNTKKETSLYDPMDFWQKSMYSHSNRNNYITRSLSAFWGPFFITENMVGCFFYTSMRVNDNPPHVISYHSVDIEGKIDHKICFVSDELRLYPLSALNNQYFAIVLATFFPSVVSENKKIFFILRYTVGTLIALKNYINKLKYGELVLTTEVKNCIQNSTIYALWLHSIVGQQVNNHFYIEINKRFDQLISLREKSHKLWLSCN
jgi:hypothetical protein